MSLEPCQCHLPIELRALEFKEVQGGIELTGFHIACAKERKAFINAAQIVEFLNGSVDYVTLDEQATVRPSVNSAGRRA